MKRTEFSLQELFDRKIHLLILAGEKLGYDWKKHQPDKALLQEQVKKAGALANKWAKEEKWVCVKPCKDLKYEGIGIIRGRII